MDAGYRPPGVHAVSSRPGTVTGTVYPGRVRRRPMTVLRHRRRAEPSRVVMRTPLREPARRRRRTGHRLPPGRVVGDPGCADRRSACSGPHARPAAEGPGGGRSPGRRGTMRWLLPGLALLLAACGGGRASPGRHGVAAGRPRRCRRSRRGGGGRRHRRVRHRHGDDRLDGLQLLRCAIQRAGLGAAPRRVDVDGGGLPVPGALPAGTADPGLAGNGGAVSRSRGNDSRSTAKVARCWSSSGWGSSRRSATGSCQRSSPPARVTGMPMSTRGGSHARTAHQLGAVVTAAAIERTHARYDALRSLRHADAPRVRNIRRWLQRSRSRRRQRHPHLPATWNQRLLRPSHGPAPCSGNTTPATPASW